METSNCVCKNPSIDRLLNLVPDSPTTVLNYLRTHPELASRQDAHGYSLVHAAISYSHADLLRALVQDFQVDPNITDEDGETCLFNAETVEMAREAVALGVKVDAQNDEGLTAAEKLADDDEQPLVAAYLREASGQSAGAAASVVAQIGGASDSAVAQAGTLPNGHSNGLQAPPPLPHGVAINVGTMHPGEEGGEPDPEFRRRIEELAARQDFDGEETQQQLRDLVSDAVSGLAGEGQGPRTRRRMG